MKISLVGSFNLADGYLGAAKALERKGHEVLFIPAARYQSELKQNHIQKIVEDLKSQSPEVILWWRAESLLAAKLIEVRKMIPGKFIMYSWDDPYQWESHLDMPSKCTALDAAFTCCMGSVQDYLRFGCKKAFYCPPGFDIDVHKPEESEEYKCDASLVCTNLYHSEITKYPHLSRKILFDSLIKEYPDLNIRIYGSKNFESDYPNHYKGWAAFDESRKVFYNSKINISTHIRPDGFMYINERVSQILGSGGLLLVDKVNGIDKLLPENSCVYFDSKSWPHQIKEILNNYDKYEETKKIGYDFAIKNLSWDCWADKIISGIGEI